MSRSEDLYQRALRVLPGGVSRNTVLRRPHPFYAVKGEGCWVTDIEGRRRLDFANNMCSLIHGHAHPAIVAAVSEQLQNGTAFTFATEAEVLYAEHMCSRSPSFEKIRFVNSGTEAVMSCLKAARAFTGRTKIAKIEGAYHGLYDYAEVSQTSNPENWGDIRHPRSNPVTRGTPQGVLDDVVVIPFNDPETAVAILSEHPGELACVLVDPMPHRVGFIPATKEYIEALRRWTAEDGSLLVFDEVITFRSEYDGAQCVVRRAARPHGARQDDRRRAARGRPGRPGRRHGRAQPPGRKGPLPPLRHVLGQPAGHGRRPHGHGALRPRRSGQAERPRRPGAAADRRGHRRLGLPRQRDRGRLDLPHPHDAGGPHHLPRGLCRPRPGAV